MIAFETNKMLYGIFIFSCGNTFGLSVVVLRAKCKNVANKMQKIGFKKRHFKRLLNAK